MEIEDIFGVDDIETIRQKPKTLEELVQRLERVGGKVYTQIIHETGAKGWMGVNGEKKEKVYFALYPDGNQQRFEELPDHSELKPGWTCNNIKDL